MPDDIGQKTRNYRISRRTLLYSLAALVTSAVGGTGIAWLVRLPHPDNDDIQLTLTPANVTKGTLIRPYYGHFSYIYTVTWLLDGSLLASGSEDHTARIWDA